MQTTKRTLAQFEALQEENQTIRASLEDHRTAVEPVLRIISRGEPVGEGPSARLEDLEAAPQKLRGLVWEAASTSAIQALSLGKSHYPRVDLQRLGEGYAADADDAKIEALWSEVQPISDLLASQLEINSEPL